MRIQVGGKILAFLIGGFTGISQGMTYEPFQTCTETAQVDSIQMTTWVDSLETAPPPYRSREGITYHAGMCMSAKDVYDAYWLGSPEVGNCTLRPGGRINDCVTMMDNGTNRELTTYYAAGGKVDSILVVETPMDKSLPKETTVFRFLTKTGYDLIQADLRDGNGPWSQILQDSIVTKGTGKVIYTKGEVNTVTTCIADGNTYACTPVGTSSYGGLQKQVWYLTGGRVDSVGTYDLQGVHIETDKWFWSARSGNSTALKARVSSPWMARPGTVFDVAGRKLPESDRTRARFMIMGLP